MSYENEIIKKKEAFKEAMACVAKKVNNYLKSKGYCVIIVGERITNRPHTQLSNLVCKTISNYAPLLNLQMIMKDDIPDIRRSRRDYKGTKTEHFLIFQKA